ncbi:atp-dependent helicase [Methylobacterium sp. J-077]|uniref:atp-dependent helicase n=1 Tax=Methylobacterium sp. J-077 TaxID=2836656 RepID=UPI001FBB2BCB|nr:atp-dependent helicase [Methylobacterium sp. J-077]MCJ2123284.1 atp-dependent helicase [Methylobacterium sp. J-077]
MDIRATPLQDGPNDRLTEPAVDVTGDGMLAQDLLNDLRAAQAKLEAAREDAASLKVLLALRTHQHDLAWQDAQRLGAELEGVRARASALEADLAEARTRTASADALAEADERTEAVRAVLGAVLDSIGSRALDRRRFQEIIARAGRAAPTDGPGAARHAVLLTEARRVLGIPG